MNSSSIATIKDRVEKCVRPVSPVGGPCHWSCHQTSLHLPARLDPPRWSQPRRLRKTRQSYYHKQCHLSLDRFRLPRSPHVQSKAQRVSLCTRGDRCTLWLIFPLIQFPVWRQQILSFLKCSQTPRSQHVLSESQRASCHTCSERCTWEPLSGENKYSRTSFSRNKRIFIRSNDNTVLALVTFWCSLFTRCVSENYFWNKNVLWNNG